MSFKCSAIQCFFNIFIVLFTLLHRMSLWVKEWSLHPAALVNYLHSFCLRYALHYIYTYEAKKLNSILLHRWTVIITSLEVIHNISISNSDSISFSYVILQYVNTVVHPDAQVHTCIITLCIYGNTRFHSLSLWSQSRRTPIFIDPVHCFL